MTSKRTDNRRYRETVGLALKFFQELWWVRHSRSSLSEEQQNQRLRALYTKQARQFREFALAKGGLIIKLGQFLSVRIDALPKEYIEELGLLQDSVTPVDTATIIAVIENELQKPIGELFASFDPEPLAAASLGQVHRARLKTGEEVAVKVQRPGIDELIETDLRSLRSIMRMLDRFTTVGKYFDVDDFCRDFEITIRAELEYLKEGANAETFQRNFLTSMSVEMPKIYWEQTTTRVLTMEFMDGIKIDDLATIDEQGIDRHQLAQRLLEIYLQMLLSDGFFHADPHPGNIFVRPDGIIQLIDFGMVGAIDPETRQGFTDLLVAVFSKDASGIVKTLRHLGFVRPDADTRMLKETLVPLIDLMIGEVGNTMTQGKSFMDMMMEGRSHFNVDAQTLDAMRELIRTQPIILPGNITFLGKALITVFTDCAKLDPDLNFIAAIEPHVKDMAGSPQDLLSTFMGDGMKLLRALPRTAQRLVSLAEKLDEGELEVRLSPAQLKRIEQHNKAQTRRVVGSVVAVGGVLAGLVTVLFRKRIK